ncbi:MAG: class I SAM-dependent methyltransferase, partial [Candidatus Aenigmarchaeota archaeon]|nr:class I SAM-dependent methyltransferase [Candidatus Aenigmarchaeota archaeon]
VRYMKTSDFYDAISSFYPFISFLDSPSRKKGLEMSKAKKDEKILCIGFGSGKELEFFKDNGCKIIGVDCSSRIVEKYGKGDCIVADIVDLPFQNRYFDLVYSAFVIDLFEDTQIKDILRGLGRIVGDKGRIVLLSNCDERGWRKWLVRFYRKVSRFYPVRNRVIDIEEIACSCGFRCVKKKRVQHGAEAVLLVKNGF